MFVLDTNVVSELMRKRPNSEVLEWMDNQLTDNLLVTSVTEAEIRTGIAILPEGEKQRGLSAAAERLFGVFFAERILPFDSDAAQAFLTRAATKWTECGMLPRRHYVRPSLHQLRPVLRRRRSRDLGVDDRRLSPCGEAARDRRARNAKREG